MVQRPRVSPPHACPAPAAYPPASPALVPWPALLRGLHVHDFVERIIPLSPLVRRAIGGGGNGGRREGEEASTPWAVHLPPARAPPPGPLPPVQLALALRARDVAGEPLGGVHEGFPRRLSDRPVPRAVQVHRPVHHALPREHDHVL